MTGAITSQSRIFEKNKSFIFQKLQIRSLNNFGLQMKRKWHIKKYLMKVIRKIRENTHTVNHTSVLKIEALD